MAISLDQAYVASSPTGVSESGGIFGIWNHPHAPQITYFGLHALQHRGQTSVGITSREGGQIYNHRGLGLLNHVFKQEHLLNDLKGSYALGHVRSASHLDRDENSNIQPLNFKLSYGYLSLTHNGNITNAQTLRKQLEKQGAVFHSSSDAELLVHLMQHSSEQDIERKLVEAVQHLTGGFNFALLVEDGLYGIVDPSCFRPLLIGRATNGAFILASETCAIYSVGAEVIDIVSAGQYVKIDHDGYQIRSYKPSLGISIEPMEFIYFARPDSDIFNINVHSARKETGKILAQEAPAPQADLVIGVPNSSLSAASGFAEASGLPYEMGLIKHQYMGRTFIQPTQAMREQGVKQKLSAVRKIVQDKSIVLVDDSIVRGTTSKRLVVLLKEAGAREIHMRIASPPIRFPNYFGIDVQTNQQLIASNRTVKQICQYIGADSLAFLSIDGLRQGILSQDHSHSIDICTAGFNGQTTADLGEYRQEFEKNLTPLQQRILKGENVDE
ncbi:amidophosphoribosyltransferase [Ignavigranum ruoffiae]|uniref:amidophosphoribosyltransferase n=1 Tax=Ignavigranum ruoffiae TaxID=89093 RepID=UPI00205FF7BC|nr:amidophosphoribosyltransferase [Ignavigranum ruoffiae]UPQ85639.1 amidophosphoribosyltransferase [Ignavigranum ruoffiae]